MVSDSNAETLLFNNRSIPDSLLVSSSFKNEFTVDYISSMTFNQTRESVYSFGQKNVTNFPYLYGAYDLF